ncbi:hypothetical protein D3C85_734070 [compost metagenome]
MLLRLGDFLVDPSDDPSLQIYLEWPNYRPQKTMNRRHVEQRIVTYVTPDFLDRYFSVGNASDSLTTHVEF